ncbi:peptidylprolyl isomerase [Herbiconiux sp. KACC 21604]|uniref:peptidylprolyl isomerase n=1 Tax=unclassified Herbiconiux TaxID=2618217 RepID=UPI00149235B7|nr:peptidylprolyl isomerase [Herbiconiux sp. SALV-R1]QJU53623.1 peptidylprolyl isomerase [Herbiconiux sp. SALV-R1]WPO88607.1 peptidylprolyl isomerase [Herbiconiux sp. KACC 21604]
MAPSNQERAAREARTRLRDYQARQQAHGERIRRRVRDNIIAGAAVVLVIAGVTAAQIFYFDGGPGSPVASPAPTSTPAATDAPAEGDDAAGQNTGDVPPATLAEDRTWTGTLTINDIPLGIELDGAAAPQAVSAFISQTQDGFFTGTSCHRLTTSGLFVLQCGDPTGTGTGGPGYSYGPVENAPADNVYPAGTIAMARQGGNGYSMGSQFFIVYDDTTLGADSAGGYTVIGKVTSGLDALESGVIAAGTADGSTDGKPAASAVITGVTVQ